MQARVVERVSYATLDAQTRRYAWEEVASQVLDVYNEARAVRAERERVGSREVMNVHDAV